MKSKFLLAAVVPAAMLFLTSCNDEPGTCPDGEKCEYGWSETMQGNDLEEIAWPDQSENYWEYTMDVTKFPNVGLRFSGSFPAKDTRFFNITLYNDETTQRIASIEDFNIEPSKGANPFAAEGVTGKNSFVVNAVPSTAPKEARSGLQNVLEFPAETKKLSVLLRVYFNSTDHPATFGDADLPEITFFDLETGKDIGRAVRAKSMYYDMCKLIISQIPVLESQKAMVFTLAPNVMYSNGPTGYVTASNRLHEGELLAFRFIPPVHPEGVADNKKADVRYWSICIGDTLTRTPVTVPDRETIKDKDGYANFFVVAESDPNFDAIAAKAKKMGINVLAWDVKKFGSPLMVFYRQMYIRDGFQYSVQKITPYPPLGSNGLPDPSVGIKDENMAHIVLGEHGPSGLKLTTDIVMGDAFDVSMMRIPSGK